MTRFNTFILALVIIGFSSLIVLFKPRETDTTFHHGTRDAVDYYFYESDMSPLYPSDAKHPYQFEDVLKPMWISDYATGMTLTSSVEGGAEWEHNGRKISVSSKICADGARCVANVIIYPDFNTALRTALNQRKRQKYLDANQYVYWPFIPRTGTVLCTPSLEVIFSPGQPISIFNLSVSPYSLKKPEGDDLRKNLDDILVGQDSDYQFLISEGIKLCLSDAS